MIKCYPPRPWNFLCLQARFAFYPQSEEETLQQGKIFILKLH